MPGPFDQKKRHGALDKQSADKELEQEGPEHSEPEPEHAQRQNSVGNASLAAMLANQEQGSSNADVSTARRKAPESKKAGDFGGDDDAVDAGPLTIEDLTSSWNPGTKKSEIRVRFLEPMPDDELPPSDEDFLAEIQTLSDVYKLPPTWTIDPLVQPSEDVVCASLTQWGAGVQRWARPTLGWRCAGALLRPPAPILQDSEGRVLHSRIRGCAIATWILLMSPALSEGATASTASFVDFCLELDGRSQRMHDMRIHAFESGKKIPLGAKLLRDKLGAHQGHVQPHPLPPGPREWLRNTCDGLLNLADPVGLVPQLFVPAADIDPINDDPLDLDAIMAEHLGPAPDRKEPLYRAAIQGAERMAGAAARTRIRYAGLCLVIAEVAALWTAGAPTQNLIATMETLDRDVAELLQLLVEVAKAAQRKEVAPSGLQAGLKRSARRMSRLRRKADSSLSSIIGGILGTIADVPTPTSSRSDALTLALESGEPLTALGFLATQPKNLDTISAVAMTQAIAGRPAEELLDPLLAMKRQAEEADNVALTSIASILLGAVHLRMNHLFEAQIIAKEQLTIGLKRRNGIVVAEATLLGMEARLLANDLDGALAMRLKSGNALWRMGARGALTLLARWQPNAP